MELFKGDATEQKFVDCPSDILDAIGLALDDFLDGAYGAVPLGELIFDDRRVSVTNAIDRDIFIHSFKELFESWAFAGTFESYITFFQKVFGVEVVIEFTVPDPGKLLINIEATGTEESPFISREIIDNDYVLSLVVDYDDDNIVFNTIQGFQTQQELETALKTLVPAGIYTEVTLTLGS